MLAVNADFIAGISAGAVTTLVAHPLDLLKVRLQVDSSSANIKTRLRNAIIPQAKSSNGSTQAVSMPTIIRSLYRGLPINLLGNTVTWGMYFSLYHYCKNQLIPPYDLHNNPENLTELQKRAQNFDNSTLYLACAFFSGTSTSLLTNPLWVLKTRYLTTTKEREMTASLSNKKSSSEIQRVNLSIRDIINKEGVKTLWRGFFPGLLGVVQGSLQFAIYDEFKSRRLRQKAKRFNLKNGDKNHDKSIQAELSKLSQWEYITISASSKVIATIALYPYQLVRSRLQAIPTNGDGYKNTKDVIVRAIRDEGGIRSLYKGLFPNLIRVVPSTTITFVVYENIQHWLKHM